MVVDHRFHEETIASTYPDYAAFPYASKASTVARARGNPSLGLLPMLARPRHRRLLRRARLVPRIFAASLPARTGDADWLVNRGTYLAQLEAL
jgi:hypothetical protein